MDGRLHPALLAGARPARPASWLSLLVGLLVLGGCGGSRSRTPDPLAVVRRAVRSTLAAGPADLVVRVSSPTTEYVLRGLVDLGDGRYDARATVVRSPLGRLSFEVLATHESAFEVQRLTVGNGQTVRPRRCWMRPHSPVGYLGGGASAQEALALVEITMRLLRDATRASEAGGHGLAAYEARVDPTRATFPLASRRGDVYMVLSPVKLAREIGQPIRLRIDHSGHLNALTLMLPRFHRVEFQGTRTSRRWEAVSLEVSLTGLGRQLKLPRPQCLAVE